MMLDVSIEIYMDFKLWSMSYDKADDYGQGI